MKVVIKHLPDFVIDFMILTKLIVIFVVWFVHWWIYWIGNRLPDLLLPYYRWCLYVDSSVSQEDMTESFEYQVKYETLAH